MYRSIDEYQIIKKLMHPSSLIRSIRAEGFFRSYLIQAPNMDLARLIAFDEDASRSTNKSALKCYVV